jgi:hypothetical protein
LAEMKKEIPIILVKFEKNPPPPTDFVWCDVAPCCPFTRWGIAPRSCAIWVDVPNWKTVVYFEALCVE